MNSYYVKVTTPETVKVYYADDLQAQNALDWVCPVWVVCKTRRAFRSMIDDWCDYDISYSAAGRRTECNRHLVNDCSLFIGKNDAPGEDFGELEALPKSKTNSAFDYGIFMSANDCATYGDYYSLACDVRDPSMSTSFVRDRGYVCDDEIEITLDEIPEYVKPD